MKARPKKPSARSASARKPAAGKRTAVARKAKVTAKPPKAARKAQASALAAECTIEHAPALQKQLAKVLASRACVTLDFSAVRRCDTAGLQVLAAFIRERREDGLAVELAGMSDNFVATTKLLGLGALFANVEAGA